MLLLSVSGFSFVGVAASVGSMVMSGTYCEQTIMQVDKEVCLCVRVVCACACVCAVCARACVSVFVCVDVFVFVCADSGQGCVCR